jgi:hypothetical protein
VPHVDEGTTSRAPAPNLSRLALRDDGALLVSLEDATDRDLEGRDVIAFLVLSAEETTLARATAEQALSSAAASILGRLPTRKP